ncbi:MAG: hypothetical protein RPT00_09260, partial [Gammaproteobacteria bacterium]
SGFVHGDLKAHNIWIKGNKPLLIDLDGMERGRQPLIENDWRRLNRDLASSDIATALFEGVGGL